MLRKGAKENHREELQKALTTHTTQCNEVKIAQYEQEKFTSYIQYLNIKAMTSSTAVLHLL